MVDKHGNFIDDDVQFDKDGKLVCDHKYHRNSGQYLSRDSSRKGAKNEFDRDGQLRTDRSTFSILSTLRKLFIMIFVVTILLMVVIPLLIIFLAS